MSDTKHLGDILLGNQSTVQNISGSRNVHRILRSFKNIDNQALRTSIKNSFGNNRLDQFFFVKGFNGQDPYLTGDVFGLGNKKGASQLSLVTSYKVEKGQNTLPEGVRTERYINGVFKNTIYGLFP